LIIEATSTKPEAALDPSSSPKLSEEPDREQLQYTEDPVFTREQEEVSQVPSEPYKAHTIVW
jgi:hypothetical protein